jgi:hypothetical protein
MHPLPFDTLAFVKRLAASGMPEAQAEALAGSLAEVALGQLATKDDVRQVREEIRAAVAELRHEIAAAEERLLAKIEAMELRLRAEFREELRKQMLWFFAMQVALVSAAFALMKVLS